MHKQRWATVILASFLFLGASTPSRGQTASPASKASLTSADDAAIDTFRSRVKEYIAQRNDAPSNTRVRQTVHVAEIVQRRQALRASIRKTRANAAQGDIFSPAASAVFRKLLSAALAGENGSGIRRTLQHAEPNTAATPAQLAVNGDYPNKHGQPLQTAPASLLKTLPPLPNGLEYRIAGKTLALRDAEANLVIDYLPNALP